jgi:hypothetical protein
MSPPLAARLKTMSAPTPTKTDNLATLYDMPDMSWSRALEALGEGSVGPKTAAFLTTLGAVDGRPHSAAIGLCILDGVPHFTSGDHARKTRNLAKDPNCALAIRLEGLDLCLEGTAEKVTDRDGLRRAAEAYASGGWPATVDVQAQAITAPYSAQSAGPGPWSLYRFTINKAIGVATAEPHSASRWTFS